uniref:Glycosyltransferase n=1 Tax=Nucleocytoviricota sp. TaxID=2809609 RepID=A0A9E8G470_9VIRU|nr:glycosyltransferase [Nucleocytoviricota sp.]UZT29058.1 glycosyltransferase [Nucleocytoviricota sp.]
MYVSLVITSCNRPNLLNITLKSFFKFNTYPIKKVIIIEDSGIKGCIDKAITNIPQNIEQKIIYNENNIGQIKSIDKAYSFVDTKYIFHCEDDWEFYNYGFIEKSLEILNSNEKIFTVWLREYKNYRVVNNGHPIDKKIHNNLYRLLKIENETGRPQNIWGGFTFNPGLRRLNDCNIFFPFSKFINSSECNLGGVEQALSVNYIKKNFVAAISLNENGFVKHIGFNDSTQHK